MLIINTIYSDKSKWQGIVYINNVIRYTTENHITSLSAYTACTQWISIRNCAHRLHIKIQNNLPRLLNGPLRLKVSKYTKLTPKHYMEVLDWINCWYKRLKCNITLKLTYFSMYKLLHIITIEINLIPKYLSV